MEKGQIFEVVIEDMSSEGQGIGRAEGLVVFVPGAVIGDKARIKLTKVKKNYAFSELLEILKPSDKTSSDFNCKSFEKGCGGCPYGRIEYRAQLELKENQIREKLVRLAGIEEPRVNDILGMEPSDNQGKGCFHYRNKAQFPVSTGGIITRKGGIVENLGEPAIGFYRGKSHEVVDSGDCLLQSAAAMAAAEALREFMRQDNITAWDFRWEKGLMRHLIVKTGFATKEVMVILVINGKGIPNINKLIEMLDEYIYEAGFYLESVVLNINRSDGEKRGRNRKNSYIPGGGFGITGDENIVAAGKPVIRDFIGELEFEISPDSFYQVNPAQTKRLYDKVREYCGLEEESEEHGSCSEKFAEPVILDIYCGVGSIGLYCADRAKQIIGIEAVREAVTDANRNAVINGVVNARYICGRAEEILPLCADRTSGGKAFFEAGGEGRGGNGFSQGVKENDEEKTGGNIVDEELAEYIRKADIAVLDPPRAGCRPEPLKAVAKIGVERIVYVSCDPATLARDIKLLISLGYEFKEATPVDMFPMTGSVECVALLCRQGLKSL